MATDDRSIVKRANIEWLMHQLDNPQVVIVDCRFQLANPNWGEESYRAYLLRVHII